MAYIIWVCTSYRYLFYINYVFDSEILLLMSNGNFVYRILTITKFTHSEYAYFKSAFRASIHVVRSEAKVGEPISPNLTGPLDSDFYCAYFEPIRFDQK